MRCPPGRTADRLRPPKRSSRQRRRTINEFENSVLHGKARRPARRFRHRRADRHREAQHSVPARRLLSLPVRLHGSDRHQPLSAHLRLFEGRPGEVRLCCQPERAGQRREQDRRRILDAAGRIRIVDLGRGDGARAQACEGGRDDGAACRRRDVVPARRCRRCAASGSRRFPARRGDAPARETAVDQDRSRAGDPARSVRARGRLHDGCGEPRPARTQQARDHRAFAAGRIVPRHDLRIRPGDDGNEPQPGAVRATSRARRYRVTRFRAGITKAISAISAGWPCMGRRTASSSICSAKST